MNNRERLLTVFKGEVPDRVPVSLYLEEEFLGFMYPGRVVDRVIDAVECSKYFGFEVMTRSRTFERIPYYLKKSFLNWDVKQNIIRQKGLYTIISEIQTPLKTLKQVETGPDVGLGVEGINLTVTEVLIKDESDFEAFIKFVPKIDRETIDEMKTYCGWSKNVIGDLGLSVPWTWGGIYNQASRLRGMQQLMMDPYLDPDFYREFMNKITELAVEAARELAIVNGDAIGIKGNIANASMIGKNFFDEFILPYEKRLVEAIHDAGSFTIYHNCGKAEALLPSYLELGITAWETVAEPPQGDNDLARAKKLVGDKITLIGNLDQVVFLKTASVAEVEERTKQIVSLGKPGGRYIFAVSDLLEKNTPFENIFAAVNTVKNFGSY